MPELLSKLGDPLLTSAFGGLITALALAFVLLKVRERRRFGVALFAAGLLLLSLSFAAEAAGILLGPGRLPLLDPKQGVHAVLTAGLRYAAGLPLLLAGALQEIVSARRRFLPPRLPAGAARERDATRNVDQVVRLEDDLGKANRDLESAREELEQQASEASRVSTKLRETLNLLLASEEKFRSIFERATDGFAIVDLASRRVLQANPRMAELLGFAAAELVRMDLAQLFGPEIGARDESRLRDLGRRAIPPIDVVRGDGSEVRLETSFSVLDVGGREVLLAIARDVSEREDLLGELEDKNRALEERERNLREMNRELSERAEKMREMNDKLRELQEVKDNFLSSVSHELRTPLTSIRSFSEILLQYRDADEDVKQEFITIINKESERLTRLINDVLDLARIEAGEMKFDFAPLSLAETAGDVLQSLAPLADARNIRVEVEFTDDLPPALGDRDKLHQVLTNLVSNALKFSPEGSRIHVGGRNAGDGMIEVTVRDQGAGIPPEELTRIFEKFRQIETGDTLSRPREGTGLGLAICREIITLHGGRIWAKSMVGKGSTFYFTVRTEAAGPIPAPIAAGLASDEAAAPAPPKSPRAAEPTADLSPDLPAIAAALANGARLPPLRKKPAAAPEKRKSALPPLSRPPAAAPPAESGRPDEALPALGALRSARVPSRRDED